MTDVFSKYTLAIPTRSVCLYCGTHVGGIVVLQVGCSVSPFFCAIVIIISIFSCIVSGA